VTAKISAAFDILLNSPQIFYEMESMSSPKTTSVNDIDIDDDVDIRHSKISANIDIGKGDIDPALQRTNEWSRICHQQVRELLAPVEYCEENASL